MKQFLSSKFDTEFIRPLRKAQNEFIQVLLTSFSLQQQKKGLLLNVEFDYDSQAVWLREGKRYIRHHLDPVLVRQYQHELESILLGHEKKNWEHDNPAFPFRFGNGGTLPVIRYGDKDYYAFFYRDISPVGWNIANGGADSFSELLDPLATIERELREELFIVDPVEGYRYVFDWSEGRHPEHPDFAIARQIWDEIFRRHDFQQLKDRELPLKWLSGFDTVSINFNNRNNIQVSDCILNINAEDFGIEIDRVAKMAVSSNAIFCDGEISNGKLVNQVVGLFEVHRFNAALAAGRKEFYPDLYFFNGKNRSGDDFETLVKEYLAYVTESGIRDAASAGEWNDETHKYGLCPVTRNLVCRYLLVENAEDTKEIKAEEFPRPGKYTKPDVFLSFASEDLDIARQVFDFLQKSGHNVFFSNETLHNSNFGEVIDKALMDAKSMIIVGSTHERLTKNWVKYEWRLFHNEILSNRKPTESSLVTFTANPDMMNMPGPLRYWEIIDYGNDSVERSLRRLNQLLV